MSEHDEQVAVVQWANLMAGQWPELDLLYAIPNGAALRHKTKIDKRGREIRYSPEGQKLTAEGMKRHIPDLCLPVARCGYHSLYIEMKWGKNKPNDGQAEMLDRLMAEGHLAVACWSAEEAIQVLSDYIRGVA